MTPCESTPRRLAKIRFSAVSRAASDDRPSVWKHAAQNAASGSAVTFISFIRRPRGLGIGVLYSVWRTRCKAGLGLRARAGWDQTRKAGAGFEPRMKQGMNTGRDRGPKLGRHGIPPYDRRGEFHESLLFRSRPDLPLGSARPKRSRLNGDIHRLDLRVARIAERARQGLG